MPLTNEQVQKISLLSDTVLYREAVAFMQRLVNELGCNPLPPTQINGLLHIADGANYAGLSTFVVHQRDRNWTGSKVDIRTFYVELEKMFSEMRRKRLSDEFSLATAATSNQEKDEIMIALAREFIQHLVAENGLLVATAKDERSRNGRKG
jgi:hypothetical protein